MSERDPTEKMPPRVTVGRETLYKLTRQMADDQRAREMTDSTDGGDADSAIRALIEINRTNQQQATIRQGRTVKLIAVAVVAVCLLVAAVAGVTYTVTRSADGGVTIDANPIEEPKP